MYLTSLHYLMKLAIPIVHMLPLSYYRKKLQNLSLLSCIYLQIHQFESSYNSMWEILQETGYKTHIIDLELLAASLTNGCRNDDMIQLGPLHS